MWVKTPYSVFRVYSCAISKDLDGVSFYNKHGILVGSKKCNSEQDAITLYNNIANRLCAIDIELPKYVVSPRDENKYRL